MESLVGTRSCAPYHGNSTQPKCGLMGTESLTDRAPLALATTLRILSLMQTPRSMASRTFGLAEMGASPTLLPVTLRSPVFVFLIGALF